MDLVGVAVVLLMAESAMEERMSVLAMRRDAAGLHGRGEGTGYCRRSPERKERGMTCVLDCGQWPWEYEGDYCGSAYGCR